ncbi:MAG: amidophosphoribosyltransferase [Candidatus Shapirobacteria bacterium]|nr:amidophosphoribosyltransferase [Candidatus Shapirobacteria bacterium]
MLQEKCAVFGVYGTNPLIEAARLVHTGLWALQHRGQESSGIVSSDGNNLFVHKGMGLVAHVYDEQCFNILKGTLAIGHNRYATFGPSEASHVQPVMSQDQNLAMAHNGNLPATTKLSEFLTSKGISPRFNNDSEMMYKAVAYYFTKGLTLPEAVAKAFPLFTGVFSALFMSKDTLVAVRDRRGIRPLSLGKIDGIGYVISSETCAINTIGGEYIRDIKPGEMLFIDKTGVQTKQLSKGKEMLDAFEFVYFSRPDSFLAGQSVNEVRKEFGRQLARENPNIKADVVIPIPDSGIPAAIGFAQESGIPFDIGLIKNRYIHRTFIRPAQSLRKSDVRLKLNPLPSVLKGKRIVLIDDSIVRGTTSEEIVKLLRQAGAREVHFLVSSPPVCFPDFYGINTPDQSELIAATKTIPEIKKMIEADSLAYLSLKGLIKAIGLPVENICTSCFTGEYPIDIDFNKEKIKYC